MKNDNQKRQKAAVFIDAENHPDVRIPTLLRHLREFDIVERHAYADWRGQRLCDLAEQSQQMKVEMHHVSSGLHRGEKKNSADAAMKRGIRRLIAEHPEIVVVIIVSGDACFATVATNLQQAGRYIVVAADPFRTSEELRAVANWYLPIGRLAYWIQGLDWLERANRYLTFSFAVRELGCGPDDLERLIDRGVVIQKDAPRPDRKTRPQIWLDRKSPAVQIVLDCLKGGINPCKQMQFRKGVADQLPI